MSKKITRERLGLEVLGKVFSKTKKFVFDSEETAQSVLQILPLYKGAFPDNE
ncbi:MAG: hypothetical protein ACUVRN_08265 [Candidatus Caldatribacteriaceae bacterium]